MIAVFAQQASRNRQDAECFRCFRKSRINPREKPKQNTHEYPRCRLFDTATLL